MTELRHYLTQRALDEDIDTASLKALKGLNRGAPKSYVGQRVAIAGLFGWRCGLQRGAELAVLELRARGVEVLAVDLTAIANLTPNIDTSGTVELSQLEAWQPTDIIIHINPPLFARVLAAFPRGALSASTLIAFWVWELGVISQAWRDCAEFVDEIWVPSPFVRQAMTEGLPAFAGPINTMPYAVEQAPMEPSPREERVALRAALPALRDKFVIGTSFSFDSNYARKNPCAAIDAFRLAFRNQDGARLIIRCNDVRGHQRLFDHLVSFAGGDPRILVWNNALVPYPIRKFYGLIDLYISLHRSEGYGLNLVEAAQAGVKVLTTGWSLAPDIAVRPEIYTVDSRLVVPLDPEGFYDRFPDAVWAEPDVVDAAAGLSKLYAGWRMSLVEAA